MKQGRVGRNAFTLVEVLIAVSLATMVMLAVLSVFRTGIHASRDIEQALARERVAYQVLERIRLDLKNAIIYSDKRAGFRGEGRAVGFFTLVDVFKRDHWLREYAYVGYRWDGESLARSCRVGTASLDEQEVPIYEEVRVKDGKFSLEYAKVDPQSGSFNFVDNWDSQHGLPAAVRIRLVWDGVPFERLVAIPLGKRS